MNKKTHYGAIMTSQRKQHDNQMRNSPLEELFVSLGVIFGYGFSYFFASLGGKFLI